MTNDSPAVGIDLGTTFSVIAYLDPAGRPWTIANIEGDPTTPSVVFFDHDAVVVGKEAVKAAALEPERVAQHAKRDMGSPIYSKPINGEHLPPEVIQSLVLQKLKIDAELKLGPFSKAVITVPAYFNEPRRKATQDAGAIAGLDVLDIINEPTAAAICFGVQHGFLTAKGEAKETEKVLVYDLGGGTFDVTLMVIDGKNYHTVGTAGDVQLGGVDWDQRIVNTIAEQFMAKHRGIDPRANPAGQQRLLREAEEAKRALSAREQVTITFEHAGSAVRFPLTRQRFEELSADLIERTRFTTANMLREAGSSWKEITRVLLVGGSTRMPMVADMLERESGKKPDRSLSADEAVAHGAAIFAGLLMASGGGAAPQMSVRNVNSHSLGVLGIEPATKLPRNAIMIPKNTSLPASKVSRFKTHKDDQRSIAVQIIEGGDASGRNSTAIGRCVIRDLPPGLPKGTPLEVAFTFSSSGRLTVQASLPNIQRDALLQLERACGLSEQKLGEWQARIRNKFRPLSLDA